MDTHQIDTKKPDGDEYEYYSSDDGSSEQIVTETISKEVPAERLQAPMPTALVQPSESESLIANFYASQSEVDPKSKPVKEKSASKFYKEARQSLLEDIVPAEDYNVKTSKLFPGVTCRLHVSHLLLLLLSVLLLHLLREEQGCDKVDVRQTLPEVA